MSDTRASCVLLRITLEGGLGSLTKQNEERKASEKAREWHPEDEGRKQASPWRDIVPKRKDGEYASYTENERKPARKEGREGEKEGLRKKGYVENKKIYVYNLRGKNSHKRFKLFRTLKNFFKKTLKKNDMRRLQVS